MYKRKSNYVDVYIMTKNDDRRIPHLTFIYFLFLLGQNGMTSGKILNIRDYNNLALLGTNT